MSFETEMREALKTFIVESLELLQEMEESLLGLEEDPEPMERINAIFRAAHTIKGSSGLFGLTHIVAFTHVVESVLDKLRDGQIAVSSELVAALLPCCDTMINLIHSVERSDNPESLRLDDECNELLNSLQFFLNPAECKTVRTLSENAEKLESLKRTVEASGNWHLFLQFGENCLRDGMDPLSFIRYLSKLGDIVELSTFSHLLPEADAMNPETSYLGFEIILNTEAKKETIENVFDFVRDSSQIHIQPIENRIPYYIDLIQSLPEDQIQLGELLIKTGVITKRELEEGLTQQKQALDSPESALIGEILVEQKTVPQQLVNAAVEKQKQIHDIKTRENQSIRVDAERLDKLIDLIGELVISTAAASLRGSQTNDVTLQEANAAVISLVEEVRDSALQLRMIPIGATFSRFQRVVRDVSKDLGKDIKLLISGADTEVDKSVVEKIGDPLMHLVRNAMDHGIESAEIRAARGKPVEGLLKLNAYHSSGNIIIEVSDDGGGLNRDKILSKAIDKGLVSASVSLSDQEIYALIFEPGFSTADQVSNLSGRGVGMDVVKRNITELRGVIEIDSQQGVGSTIRIHLPLTLAIIDGFLAGVGETTYVIPLDRVVECVELPADDSHDYMELRGEVLPFIRLGQLFRKQQSIPKRQNVIVVEHLGFKAGLVVDRLMGELQTVIKPLGKLFSHVQGVGGSTILGNGEVALIIDVATLLKQQEHNHLHAA